MIRQERNDAESLWAVLEVMTPEERKGVTDDGPAVTPRLAGYVCRLLSLDGVNHWERFTDVPVNAVHRLKVRYLDATTEQARGAILSNYQLKHKRGWVNSGWKDRM